MDSRLLFVSGDSTPGPGDCQNARHGPVDLQTLPASSPSVSKRWRGEVAYAVLSRVLGALLLGAAALKLAGVEAAPVAEIGVLSSPWLITMVIEAEVCLGLWLLWGRFQSYCWLITLATFVVFASVSGYAGWLGRTSCGCFGNLQASPWYVFSADCLAITLLSVARPPLGKSLSPRPLLFSGALCIAAVALLTAALAAVGALFFGSPRAAHSAASISTCNRASWM
jgi:hypothetical protein